MKKKVYYQPEIDSEGFIIGHSGNHSIFSFQVWEKKENLLKEYPNCHPLPYEEGEIENPTIMDLKQTHQCTQN